MVAVRGIQISKTFHHFHVLREVSFEVAEGSCFALFGPNGAGKTTLLRILATLYRPSSGRFEVMGHDGIRDRSKIRSLIVLIAHGSYLYDELNAIENLRFTSALHGIERSDQEMKTALDRVGIGAFSEMKARFFSAGMKKRLAIAKALLIRPKVLLLDEPYASLDEGGMAMMNDTIREMTAQGAAVVMSTHDRTRSAEVAREGGVLRRGELQPVTLGGSGGGHAIS